jgi:osmotically-inducible protein OsmY
MEAKAAAEQDARSVSGVRDVRNEIEIAMDEKRDVK